jgi:pimeloyl-ACP methyl ester carboxylesterase
LPALHDHLALASLRLQGYKSRVVPTSVGAVHVLEARGSGPLPPLVLLHGFSSSGVHYLPMVGRLRESVSRLILPDMPAHGFSDTPREGPSAQTVKIGLREALDAVVDEPAMLFGNSMGGMAAVDYALHRPDRILGLLLCSPGGAAMSRRELEHFLRTFQVESHGDALDFVDRVFAKPSVLRQAIAWGVRRTFANPDMRSLLASVTPDDLLRPEQLRALQMPVHVSWGQRDRVLPRAHLAYFRRHLPRHAVVEEPEDLGHTPYLEAPGPVARTILAFAERLRCAARPPLSLVDVDEALGQIDAVAAE